MGFGVYFVCEWGVAFFRLLWVVWLDGGNDFLKRRVHDQFRLLNDYRSDSLAWWTDLNELCIFSIVVWW